MKISVIRVFTLTTEMSAVMKNSQFGDFSPLSLLGFFSLNVDLKQTLKANLSCLAVSYHKHRLSHLPSLATNPGELALSQYDQKSVLSSSLNNSGTLTMYRVLIIFTKQVEHRNLKKTSVPSSKRHTDLIIQLFQETRSHPQSSEAVQGGTFVFRLVSRGRLILKVGHINIFPRYFIKNCFKGFKYLQAFLMLPSQVVNYVSLFMILEFTVTPAGNFWKKTKKNLQSLPFFIFVSAYQGCALKIRTFYF